MKSSTNIVFSEKPKLKQPVMVCGISGWVDGGQAATGGIEYLIKKLSANRFAEMHAARFHLFQVPGQLSLRPYIRIEDGLLKEHRLPQNQFYYWASPDDGNDLILFLGTEPNMNWEEYTGGILGIAKGFEATRIYLLGGVLDKTPHTKEPAVSCTCSSPELKKEMQKYGVQFTNYEGPGRYGTTLLYSCQEKGMEMVTFTARTTYYPEFNIVISHNPTAIRALVRRLDRLLKTGLDMADLDEEVGEFVSNLNSMTSQRPEFRAYIEQLEKGFTEFKYEEPLEMSPGEAVEMAEEFLKQKKDE